MSVSATWFQICSDPLLWKTLYFQEEWTVVEDVLREFESRLWQLQAQFDSKLRRIRPSTVSFNADIWNPPTPPSSRTEGIGVDNSQQPCTFDHLFNQFYYLLDAAQAAPGGANSFSRLYHLRMVFKTIVNYEIGEPFSRATTFTLNNNGAIRVHVDWHYLYKNRNILDKNWEGGSFSTTLLDGAPDVTPPNQREGIYCVVFDRNILAAGARDNFIRLWDMEDFSYQGRLESHEGSVLCLQLDSKRDILVSGSSDSTIKVWNLATRQVEQTLHGHTESVLGLHFEGDHIVSCSRDTTARVWRLSGDSDLENTVSEMNILQKTPSASFPRFELVHTLRGHRAAVNSVHFIKDMVATASGDRTVRLWNLKTGGMIRTIAAHGRGIACVNLTEKLVVTGSSDHIIKILNRETGEEVRRLDGHTGLVRTIQTDNKMVISGSYDQTIRIWDLETGKMLHELSNCHDSKYLTPFKRLLTFFFQNF
jgi:F-box and WD-40 domain protein 1/11